MSEYTVPLGWADVVRGMTVELRHPDYPTVVGWVDKETVGCDSPSMLVNGAWYWMSREWTLWVKPEPVEVKADPLVKLLWLDHISDNAGTTAPEIWDACEGAAKTIRAAGYMTEAEWEAKRPRPELPELDYNNASRWPIDLLREANQSGQMYAEYARSWNRHRVAANKYLASTPGVSKP